MEGIVKDHLLSELGAENKRLGKRIAGLHNQTANDKAEIGRLKGCIAELETDKACLQDALDIERLSIKSAAERIAELEAELQSYRVVGGAAGHQLAVWMTRADKAEAKVKELGALLQEAVRDPLATAWQDDVNAMTADADSAASPTEVDN